MWVSSLGSKEIQPEDRLISFDSESFYTNVPVKETLQIIQRKLFKDPTLEERTPLSVSVIMDVLVCCLNNSYFQEKDTFYSQMEGLPIGSSLSPVIANIYMEWFKNQAIDKALVKPKLWLRYVDDTFIIWNGNDEEL